MTGKEFVDILIVSGLFREKMPAYLVDSPITHNRIPSHIRLSDPNSLSLNILLNYTPNLKNRKDIDWQGGITVEFYLGNNNLFACYKLSELTVMDLVKEMDKFLSNREIYIKWKKCELRGYLLESLID